LSNKSAKRKAIATSCCEIFAKNGFQDISISKIANIAGIGKGTIYEYFINKEDIVCELMSCLENNYNQELTLKIETFITKQDKLLCLFGIFLEDETIQITRKEIFKQFLIVCMTKPTKEIIGYNTTLRGNYIKVIDDIIDDKKVSIEIYDYIVGLFVSSITLNDFDLKGKIIQYIEYKLKNLGEKND